MGFCFPGRDRSDEYDRVGPDGAGLPGSAAEDPCLAVEHSASPEKDRAIARAHRHEVSLHLNPVDVASLLATADLAFGAGCSSAWERCCLGVPAVAVGVADNQRDVLSVLSHAGAALVVENPTAETVARTIGVVLTDSAKRSAMAVAAIRLCDCIGAVRIALLHCDLDVYPPTLTSLQAAWPRLVPGGIDVFDSTLSPTGESRVLATSSSPRSIGRRC